MDFFCTNISPKAIELVNQTLQAGWVSEGPMVKEFEDALRVRLGLRNPVALNSGTTALHFGLVLANVGPGDEVILPAQTFVATGLVILMQGAVPVFADIDPMTGNISPSSIKQKITSRTKAIMPVHWSGYPCDLDEINAIAKHNNLAVIEDAAHALGATYKGKAVGSISRFTAFSFQAIKHVTTGDGGALCCLNNDDARAGLARRWFGIDRANSKPSILGEREYDLVDIGYKYHMNDLAAALGLGNLDDFPRQLLRRRQIASQYVQGLKNVPGLKLLEYKNDRESSYWLFTVLVERRIDFIRKLREHNIPASVVHLRIDNNTVFGGASKELCGQEEFNEHQVALPVHNCLTDEDVQTVIATVKTGW